MKEISWTFIFSFLFIGTTFWQSYNPLIRSNTYWDENHGNGQDICYASGGDRFYFQGDTIINGTLYQILRAYPLYQVNPGPYCAPFGVDYSSSSITAFMREDTVTRQVFVIADWLLGNPNYTEALLFDFTLNAGDTLYSAGGAFPIDSVSVVTLSNGELRKKWHIDYGGYYPYYIEGIGGSEGIYHNFEVGLGHWEVPLCVTENGLSIWGDQCSSIVLGIEEVNKEQKFQIAPNPTTDYLNIHYQSRERGEDLTFSILDMQGKVIQTHQTAASNDKTYILPVSDFAAGLYILEVRRDGELVGAEQFVKN